MVLIGQFWGKKSAKIERVIFMNFVICKLVREFGFTD